MPILEPTTPRVETDAIIAVAREAERKASLIAIPGRFGQMLLKPNGELQSLEALLDSPSAKRGLASFIELQSFLHYVQDHRTAGTQLFAQVAPNWSGVELHAVLDGHVPNTDDAGWGSHVARFTWQPTPEWADWIAKHNQLQPQADFAQFIEDHSPDIVEPDAATMLEIALTLEACTMANFRQATRLQNGQHQIRYEENVEARAGANGQLIVPERMAIDVQPFEGAERRRIAVRLRYRLRDGKLAFAIQIERPHLVLKTAWDQARGVIEGALNLPVLMGKWASS